MTAPQQRTARSGDDLRILRAAVFAAVCVVLAAAGHSLASCATVPLWALGAGFLGAVLVVVPLAGRARSLPGIVALLALGQTVLHTLFGLAQHGTAATASGAASTGAATSTGTAGSVSTLSDAALVDQAARLLCGSTAAAISPAEAYKVLVAARVHPDTGMGTGAGTGMGSMHHPADALSTTGSATSLLPSLPMLLGHVLAALAAGWLLRRGDLALLRLAELSAQAVTEGALVRSLRGAFALVRALRAGLPVAPEAGPRVPLAALLAPPKPRTTALQHTVIRRGPPASAAFVLAV